MDPLCRIGSVGVRRLEVLDAFAAPLDPTVSRKALIVGAAETNRKSFIDNLLGPAGAPGAKRCRSR
jgi:hypothetical protein